MPKETLPALERDTERLLFAGAQVARGDSDLEDRKQRLAPLAPKAPALAKIVEQIEKVQKAGNKSAASELLNLAALMAQVRGAQGAPNAPAGDLAALPKAEPLESPLSPTELTSLVNALTGGTKRRQRIISDAVERDAIRDLRLLPFCVRALSDSGVSYVVENELLPKLGKLVIPELRSTLRIAKGLDLDARKLRVIVAIEKAEARPLLLEAIEKGSPEVRKTALSELAELEPAAAEPIALKLITEDRSAEVRRAATDALGGGTSDAALDALMKAFTEEKELRRNAGYALARLSHPRATERALALITPELLSLGALKLPKADTKAKKEQNEKLEAAHREKVAFMSLSLDLLASRKDKTGTAEKVLSVFREHKLKEVKNAAAQALLKSGYEGAFDELAPSIIEADWSTRSEFIDGILQHDAAHAFDRLGKFLKVDGYTKKDLVNRVEFANEILNAIEGHHDEEADKEPEDEAAAEAAEEKQAAQPPGIIAKDPRWVDTAIGLLQHKELGDNAIDVVSKVKSPKVLEAVLALIPEKGKVPDHAWSILNVVKQYKDPRVPAVMVRLLDGMNGIWARRTIFNALREHDDPAMVQTLKNWAAGKKKKLDKHVQEALDELVQYLERDRALAAGV